MLFLSGLVMGCLVSFFILSIFTCTLSQAILILRWISSGLLSSPGVLCWVLVWCLVHIWTLTSVGFVTAIVFQCSIGLVSWLYFCSDLELSACSPARFLRSGVSKGDLTLLLMCWLTDLGMSPWSIWLQERPVFWFDLCGASVDSSLSWLRR